VTSVLTFPTSPLGAVGICHLNKDVLLTAIEIGEVSDVANFIACLPDDWASGERVGSKRLVDKAFKGPGEPPRFQFAMDMFPPGRRLVLRAYFDTDLRHLAVFGHFAQLKGCDQSMVGLFFSWLRPHELQIQVPVRLHEYWPKTHPNTQLCHRTFNLRQVHVPRPGVQRLFPKITVDEWFRRQGQLAAHKNLKGELERLCTGWARFYYLPKDDGPGLVDLDCRTRLFGLTWIFPWAPAVIKELNPNCVELDGTFESLDPYTLAIFQVIVANESLPIGLGIAPTETTTSYQRLYQHLFDVLGDDAALLKDIPVLSDRGPGLESFVSWLSLIHLICHWHLIHGAGASSIGGDWFRRLLGAGNLEEAKEIAETIKCEMAAFAKHHPKKALFLNASYHQTLLAMLAAVDANDEEQLAWWARWARPGCPTTTNAAESIHALINELTRHARSFFHGLQIIKEYLFKRFDLRNSPDRRAQRSIHQWLTPKKVAKMTPGNVEFYKKLRQIGRGGPLAEFGWTFPGELASPTSFPDPTWSLPGEGLPPEWGAELEKKRASRKKAQEEKKTEASADAPAASAPRVEGSAAYWRTGRLIWRTVKLIGGSRKQGRDRVQAAVWDKGRQLGLREQEVITGKEETVWRFAVYEALELLPPKTD
jgi:hypothetical protein